MTAASDQWAGPLDARQVMAAATVRSSIVAAAGLRKADRDRVLAQLDSG